jgi:two-component system sensor histidine kinase ChiS
VTDDRPSILIIDDTPDTVRLISGVLRDEYQLRVATRGVRGIELAAKHAPDVVLLDVVMPELDGYETLRRLRARNDTRHLPVIFLTAQDAEEAERRGLELGAADYITKPISPAILRARVKTQVELKRANDLLRDQNQLLETLVSERTKELEDTNEALARFVPDEFLAEIGRENIANVRVGDHVHSEITVMFCDIRGYTTLAESMSPRQAFEFINEHLGSVGPLIREHSGLVAQFYGDGIMAIFPRSPSDAINAAIAMQRKVDRLNVARAADGRPTVVIGIGLNAGPLTIGVIGDGQRADTGVVGDTVNAAARMEQLTKTYGVRILASESVVGGLESEYTVRFLDRVTVRGRNEAVAVYDIFEADPEQVGRAKRETLEDLGNGQGHFAAGRFADAIQCFGAALKVMPDDRTTQLYLERSASHLLDDPRQAQGGDGE